MLDRPDPNPRPSNSETDTPPLSKKKMQDIQDTNPAHSLCKTRDCNLHPSTLSHVCEPMCHAGFTGAEHQGASPCIAPGAATQRRSPSITCGAHNTMSDTGSVPLHHFFGEDCRVTAVGRLTQNRVCSGSIPVLYANSIQMN